MAAPSLHKSGGVYAWEAAHHLVVLALAPIGAALLHGPRPPWRWW